MATQGSYKRIDDGLVLHFDTANIKCFRGEPTVNLWSGVLRIYNNYGVPATLVTTGEKYQGYTVYRLGMTVTDAYSSALTSFRTGLSSHGVCGGSMTFKANTKYTASIIWKPINKFDVIVGGIASNIGGWTSQPTEDLKNGWFRYTQTRNGMVTTDKSDNVYHSFISPSLQLNETVYIDFCCPQIEEKGYSTPYTPTSRGTTVSTGGGFADLSGYNNHGELVNGVSYNSNNCGSLVFDGIEDYVNLGDVLNVSTGDYTINCWVYIKGNSTNFTTIFSKKGLASAAAGYAVYYNGLIKKLMWSNGDGNVGQEYYTNNTIPLDTWINIVCIRNTNETNKGYFYINGILYLISNNPTGLNVSNNYNLTIGKNSTGTLYFDSSISIFQIYNRALSQSEITQIYNSTKTRYI